jgi:hypothetical protein
VNVPWISRRFSIRYQPCRSLKDRLSRASNLIGVMTLSYLAVYLRDQRGLSNRFRAASIRAKRALDRVGRRVRARQKGSIQIVSGPTLPRRSSSAHPTLLNASSWNVLPTAAEKARFDLWGIVTTEPGTLTTRTQSPTRKSRSAVSMGA